MQVDASFSLPPLATHRRVGRANDQGMPGPGQERESAECSPPPSGGRPDDRLIHQKSRGLRRLPRRADREDYQARTVAATRQADVHVMFMTGRPNCSADLFTIGRRGQPAQTTRFLMNQTIIKTPAGWKWRAFCRFPFLSRSAGIPCRLDPAHASVGREGEQREARVDPAFTPTPACGVGAHAPSGISSRVEVPVELSRVLVVEWSPTREEDSMKELALPVRHEVARRERAYGRSLSSPSSRA